MQSQKLLHGRLVPIWENLRGSGLTGRHVLHHSLQLSLGCGNIYNDTKITTTVPKLWQHKCLYFKKERGWGRRGKWKWKKVKASEKNHMTFIRNLGAYSLWFHWMRGHEKQLWNTEGFEASFSSNQKVRSKQWRYTETTSSFHRGGGSTALKDASISTKSATKPSSGFALEDIKSSIFQIPPMS